MILPSPAATRASQAWKLSWTPVQPHGKAGEHLSRGTGSSLEFQDRRSYNAGDDIRHLDWRAFARTGDLTVKLYREELMPRLDLLLDTSASMDVGEGKGQLALDLAVFLALVARRQGFSVRMLGVGDETTRLDLDQLLVTGIPFEGRQPLSESLQKARAHLRPGTLRVMVSDYLSPYDAREMVRGLAQRAGGLGLFQVLSEQDLFPVVGSALRMEDAETGAIRDMVLDAETVEAYLGRLRRLRNGLENECRRAGARFASLSASTSLDELCRHTLARTQWIEPG